MKNLINLSTSIALLASAVLASKSNALYKRAPGRRDQYIYGNDQSFPHWRYYNSLQRSSDSAFERWVPRSDYEAYSQDYAHGTVNYPSERLHHYRPSSQDNSFVPFGGNWNHLPVEDQYNHYEIHESYPHQHFASNPHFVQNLNSWSRNGYSAHSNDYQSQIEYISENWRKRPYSLMTSQRITSERSLQQDEAFNQDTNKDLILKIISELDPIKKAKKIGLNFDEIFSQFKIFASMADRKYLIRKFVNAKFSITTNTHWKSFPWQMLLPPWKIDNWPERVPFINPSKLNSAQLDTILESLVNIKFSRSTVPEIFYSQSMPVQPKSLNIGAKTQSHVAPLHSDPELDDFTPLHVDTEIDDSLLKESLDGLLGASTTDHNQQQLEYATHRNKKLKKVHDMPTAKAHDRSVQFQSPISNREILQNQALITSIIRSYDDGTYTKLLEAPYDEMISEFFKFSDKGDKFKLVRSYLNSKIFVNRIVGSFWDNLNQKNYVLANWMLPLAYPRKLEHLKVAIEGLDKIKLIPKS